MLKVTALFKVNYWNPTNDDKNTNTYTNNNNDSV